MIHSMLREPRVLVLGLGDPAWGDEGVGVHLARSLLGTMDGVAVEASSASAGFFLEAFREYDALILIDAVQCGDELGRVFVMSPYALTEWKGTDASCERALEEALATSRQTGLRVPFLEVVGVCVRGQERTRDRLSPALTKKYDGILKEVRQVVLDSIKRARESLAWPSPPGR